MHLRSPIQWAAPALAALAVAAFAVDTKTWSQNEQADFEKATLKGVALRSDGRLSLSPELKELLDASSPYLWAIARDSKGNVYTAGGGPGGSAVKIHRVALDGKVSAWAEVEGLEVHALAIDKQDRVYAATTPDAKIWRIGGDGKPALFHDLKSKYVWAMEFNSKGELFAATGDQGDVIRVTPDGKGQVFFRSDEAHARALAIDAKDNLILGTEPSGLVLRVSPAGAAFVLHQMSKRESTAVAVAGDGTIYAAATGAKSVAPLPLPISLPAPVPAAPAPGAAAASANPAARAIVPPPTLNLPAGGVTGGSEVVRIDPDGAPTKLWSHAQDVVYAIALDSGGRAVIGTGNKGAIYRIESPTSSTLLASAPVGQVTSLLAGQGGAIYAATGNVGKLFQLGPGLEKKGTVESDVFDAQFFSYWGRLNDSVTANGGSIQFETRSGNLDRPGKTWSNWSPLADGRVTSPPARFLQWRATLTGAAELSGVDVAWQSKNVPPRVEAVEATPLNYKFPQPTIAVNLSPTLSLPPLGKPRRSAANLSLDSSPSSTLTYAKGTGGVRWMAADDNGDTLQFKVEIKGAAETAWKPLKSGLREKQLSFDSTAFPDGEYAIRVTASDAPSNPPGQSLEAFALSSEFLIDNTPPAISALAAKPAGAKVELTFSAKDALSWISKAEYSVNGVEWMVVEPQSRLSDSRELTYKLTFDRPQPGELSIAVRVSDEYENQSTAKVVVP
ncbi:MAG: hypothetical protein SFV18_19760 [Bryobacteraceae bacterium]|nr:hypothetical protein [Bryobacteraceae bacterium]